MTDVAAWLDIHHTPKRHPLVFDDYHIIDDHLAYYDAATDDFTIITELPHDWTLADALAAAVSHYTSTVAP